MLTQLLRLKPNVIGSVNLLDAVRECLSTVRSLVYITSDKCYENREWVWGYREHDQLGGHDPYSASKASAEILFSLTPDHFFLRYQDWELHLLELAMLLAAVIGLRIVLYPIVSVL